MTCDARLFQPSELSAKFRSGLIIFRPLSFLISARFFLTTVFIKNSRRAGLSFCSETSVRLSSDAGSHCFSCNTCKYEAKVRPINLNVKQSLIVELLRRGRDDISNEDGLHSQQLSLIITPKQRHAILRLSSNVSKRPCPRKHPRAHRAASRLDPTSIVHAIVQL